MNFNYWGSLGDILNIFSLKFSTNRYSSQFIRELRLLQILTSDVKKNELQKVLSFQYPSLL